MKRTKHPNGLELGWDGVFWIRDGKEDKQGSYNSYIEAQGYPFVRISALTVPIMTAAQQLLWQGDWLTGHTLNPYMRQWLEQNIGERGPDWYAREEPFDLFFLSILFRRRADALKLVQHVKETLELDKSKID